MFLPESHRVLNCQLLCKKDIFQIICLNYETRIMLDFRSIFSENLAVKEARFNCSTYRSAYFFIMRLSRIYFP